MERFSDRMAPQTHSFNPHATLAYILAGSNPELDGDTSFEGWPVTFTTAMYSGKGSRSRMQIGTAANEEARDERGRWTSGASSNKELADLLESSPRIRRQYGAHIDLSPDAEKNIPVIMDKGLRGGFLNDISSTGKLGWAEMPMSGPRGLKKGDVVYLVKEKGLKVKPNTKPEAVIRITKDGQSLFDAMRQSEKANEADFDESKHPRDASGKFAPEPGISGSSEALEPSSKYPSTQVLDDLPEKELLELDSIEKQYPPLDEDGIDTCHRQSDGNEEHPHYTAARLLLHNKIVSEIRADAPAQAAPEFLLMGGGTAAGKSTVIKAGKIVLPDRPVMIDCDAVKAKLPEYQAMVNNGDTRAAGYCHNESSDIAKRAMNESFVGKQNVVLDGTGNSSTAGVEQKCALARAAGFKVRAEYVTCSVDEAIRRATERAKETGRMVGEAQIRNLHRHVSQIFPEAVKKGLFDEAHLWDTEGNSPVLVASAKGTELTVHDQAAWARFLLKGQ